MGDTSDLCQLMVSSAGDDVWIVELSGELDISNATEVGRDLAAVCTSRGGYVVVVLTGLTFVDSSGFTGLASAVRAVQALGGELVFAAPSERLRHVMEIMQTGDLLRVADSVEAAIAARSSGHVDPASR